MRNFLFFTIALMTLFACTKKKKAVITVIYSNNQRIDGKMVVDTLINQREINLPDTPIDLFYTHENFQFPYYVPSNGMYKDTVKDKECDMNIYPQTVKCYEYDSRNRVKHMHVSGSGTESDFTYTYNEKGQVATFTNNGDKYILKYNDDGNLIQVKTVKTIFDHIYDFTYQ
jgi:YD repeat-containing protein